MPAQVRGDWLTYRENAEFYADKYLKTTKAYRNKRRLRKLLVFYLQNYRFYTRKQCGASRDRALASLSTVIEFKEYFLLDTGRFSEAHYRHDPFNVIIIVPHYQRNYNDIRELRGDTLVFYPGSGPVAPIMFLWQVSPYHNGPGLPSLNRR